MRLLAADPLPPLVAAGMYAYAGAVLVLPPALLWFAWR
jgi:hypothetical protein